MNPEFARYDDFFDFAVSAGWSDGFPVVPPEQDRIDAALGTLTIDPQDVVGEASHEGVSVTARDVAMHSVLAGCLPEYLPAVIASVQAFFDGIDHRVPRLADTAQCIVLNGPIRKEIDVNCGLGAFGPGWRANATIGRALRLLIGTAFGTRQSLGLGDPALYTFCFGEDEERSPWAPLHVQRGFAADCSTATVHSADLYVKQLDRKNTTPEPLLDAMVGFLRGKVAGADWYPEERCSLMLVFGDEYHRQFRAAGWTKEQMRDYLYPRLSAEDGGPFHPVRLFGPEDLVLVAAGGLALSSFWSLISFGARPATRAISPLQRRSRDQTRPIA